MTLTINSDNLSDSIIVRQVDEFNRIKSEIFSLSEEIKGADVNNLTSDQKNIIKQLNILTRNHAIAYSRYLGMQFSATSYNLTQQAQTATLVKAYFDSSRILASSVTIEQGEDKNFTFASQFDLTKNDIRAISFILQSARAVMVFNIQRGLEQSAIEDFVLSSTISSNSENIVKETSVPSIFEVAKDQDIESKLFWSGNLQEVSASDYSEEAKIRISHAINKGNMVWIPSRTVTIGGVKKIGWLEIDPVSGKLVDTYEDGRHLNIIEYIGTGISNISQQYWYGFAAGSIVGIYGLIGIALLPRDIKKSINEYSGGLNQLGLALYRYSFCHTIAGPVGDTPYCLGFISGLRAFELFAIYYAKHDPAMPDMLVSVAVSTNDPIVPNTQPHFNTLVVAEPFFTLPTNQSQLASLYRLHIQNTGPEVATYRVTFPNQPAGFTIKSSLPEVTIPAGETGVVGIMLIPNAGLPAPGAQVPFQVTITDTATNQTQTTPITTFTTPDVVGITLDAAPAQSTTAPGGTVEATLTVKSVGNVAALNIPLTLETSTGLSVSGLPVTVSLGLGETKTFPLTLTTNSTTLNDTLRATITASFGQDLDGNPYKASAVFSVTLASETAQAAFCGVQPATEAARSNLAATLNNLGIAINLLEGEPGNSLYRDRLLALLDSLIAQLNGPALTPLIAGLTAARAALANGDPNALADLRTQLSQLCTTLTDSGEDLLLFELSLLSASGVAQPGSPAPFYIQLHNTSDQTASYNLSLGALPAGVTGQLNLSSVTLAPGESTSVDQGQPLFVTLTPSTQVIQTFEFTVTAALDGSSLSRSVQGILLARPETLQITHVQATPGFTEPGGLVQISADILSAVNQSRPLQAIYSVKDTNGAGMFTSTPTAFTTSVIGTLTTVALGALDTTGYAKGQYSVEVALQEADGTPLNGITAQGRLLIGTPLTASLSLNPSLAPPGDAITQASLTLTSQTAIQNPEMQLLAQIDTKATALSLAVQGDYAYVCGTEDITIFNISDPRHPQIIGTVADTVMNGFGISICRIIDNHLIVNAQENISAGSLRTLVFDLTDPTAPALVSSTNLPYRFAGYWYSKGRIAFVPFATKWSNGPVQGDFATFDYSDFHQPKLLSALWGFKGLDGGGPDWVQNAIPVGDRYAFLGIGDAKGTAVSARGRLLTVDTLDPAHMAIVQDTTVPGTKYVFGMTLVDHIVWVLGTDYATAQWSLLFDYPNLTLTAFDATDPLDLQVVQSIPLPDMTTRSFSNTMSSLGNGFIAIGGLRLNGKPLLTLVDVNDPQNPRYSTREVVATLGEIQRRENILFTPSDAGLGFYDIGQVIGLSYAARVPIPKNTGVSWVADSFNIPPNRIETGSDFDTLVWERALNNARPQDTLTWQLQAIDMAPAEARPVTGDTRIDFTASTGDAGQLTLPPAELVARQVLSLTPQSRTVKPGETASYMVGIDNPTDQPVSYDLSVQGTPNGWAQLASPVTIPAQGSQNLPLNLLTTADSEVGQYGFVVTAMANTHFTAYLLGTLILQQEGGGGELGPDVSNPAQGVSITLTPTTATAGLGTAATFTARVTNLGDETATFNLTGGFPAGFAAIWGETQITLLPGLSNYRDVLLTITPPATANPGDYGFSVTATAAGAPAVTDQATGTVRVVNLGVEVALSPSPAALSTPTTTARATLPTLFTLRVTNTGRVRETYDLTLAGPLALYATLALSQVTLDPGASQNVLINVAAIDTALPGELRLIGIATAHSDARVQDSDAITLNVPASRGLDVSFDPRSQTLPAPGPATFLLRVQNTGNIEEAYEAVITATAGPVSAALEGLDGQPTQRIATFRLPALSTGLVTLDTILQQRGTGQVTVTVNTLAAPALSDADAATVLAQNQPPPPPPPSSALPIPTLNEWMQALLAFLLLLIALAWVSRRRYSS